jgi:preprotein translocase SecE subunit
VAVEVARTGEQESWFARLGAAVRGLPATYRNIVHEMRRVTWPHVDEIRKMSVMVIVLSLFIGGVIAAMDFTLQQVLVRWIPQVFAGR